MAYDTIGNWWPENPDANNVSVEEEERPSFSENPVFSDPTGFFDGNDGIVPSTPAVDPRDTYTNPDPTAKRVGTDAGGNPIWQLIDAGGDLVQWGINSLGSMFGVQNLGKPGGGVGAATGLLGGGGEAGGGGSGDAGLAPGGAVGASVGVSNPKGTNLQPTGGGGSGGLDNLISNLISGNNAQDKIPGINISPSTVNYSPSWLTSDSSVRSSSSTIINSNANPAGIVESVTKAIADIFRSGNPPAAASPVMTPMNDSIFGSAQFPGYANGRAPNPERSQPGSLDTTVATVKGALPSVSAVATPQNLLLVAAVLAVAVGVALFIRRR